jgi:hypothetical protein
VFAARIVSRRGPARGAHYLAAYGRQRPAETLLRTAVSARFMVRMGSPVRFRRGAPHKTSSSGRVQHPACCMPGGLGAPVCQRFASRSPTVVVRTRSGATVLSGLRSGRLTLAARWRHQFGASSSTPTRANAPWCSALLRRFRVERRASGDASSVMAGPCVPIRRQTQYICGGHGGSSLGVWGLSPVGGCGGCSAAVASAHE